MSSRAAYNPLRANGVKPRSITFSFYPQNTGTPTIRSDPGKFVASLARTAAGKFTITMRDNWPTLIGTLVNLTTEDDATDMYAQGGTVTLQASGATVVVKLKTGSTNTDLAASGSLRYVTVNLMLDDSNRWPSA